MKHDISFNEIYQQYYKKSFLFVKSYTNDADAAEDIVSDSFINLWSAIKKGNVQNPLALLLSILRNESLNYLKHLKVKRTAMESISSKLSRDLDYRILSLQACDPEEIYSSEITEIVTRTLLSLPEQTRRVFEMSRYESRPVKEIAEELSISTKAVEYHITKSLKALRLALDDYLPLFYFLFLFN
ncbi:RNA polymerase sigma-70 factor [Bacteroides sp. 519]|uniref:RNA polymerase sigma-70 factor n=1 Tax=Bacteroides sp. 519 TaxID=2302937 RepID=UPI0013D7AAA5|nr:RNA polymerase sigma-70 factor [Bacteroides sp. 519]NDV59481.1 RNA polymerase sigma-70 factor [Bacteroides sp. 519]